MKKWAFHIFLLSFSFFTANSLLAQQTMIPKDEEPSPLIGGKVEPNSSPGIEKQGHEEIDDEKLGVDFRPLLRIQMRFFASPSDAQPELLFPPSLTDTGNTSRRGTPHADFRARRIFVGGRGSLNRHWEYNLILNLTQLIGDTAATDGQDRIRSGLQEGWIGYSFNENLIIRTGSIKTPFAREALTSSGALTTLERSTAHDQIARLYETGIRAEGQLWRKTFSYMFGIFNGNGGFLNGKNGESGGGAGLTALRIKFDPLGEYRNGLSIFDNQTQISFGIGGTYEKHKSPVTRVLYNLGNNAQDIYTSTFDISLVYSQISLETALYHSGAMTNSGSYQSGYMITLSRMFLSTLQPWTRYETYWDSGRLPENTGDKDISKVRYLSFGLNYYAVDKHMVKFQMGYHMGLNSFYPDPANKTASQDYNGRDDWFGFQMQISI